MHDEQRPWRYRLAGLDVSSDFVLLEATLHDAAPPRGQSRTPVPPESPLHIVDGRRRGLTPPTEGPARTADAQRLRFVVPDVGRFLVEHGTRIVVWPTDDGDAPTLSQQITGSALALALMQRGTLVLHGAVVCLDQRAVVLVGHSGDGKSTLAAALARRGHQVVADDLAVVDVRDDDVRVRGVSPLVRLADDASMPAAGLRTWRASGKTAHVLATASAGKSRPAVTDEDVSLAAIVGLAWGEAIDVASVRPVEAALLLLEHAYCRPAFARPQATAALGMCARLAGRCSIWRASRPHDLTQLPRLVDHIERRLAVTT